MNQSEDKLWLLPLKRRNQNLNSPKKKNRLPQILKKARVHAKRNKTQRSSRKIESNRLNSVKLSKKKAQSRMFKKIVAPHRVKTRNASRDRNRTISSSSR